MSQLASHSPVLDGMTWRVWNVVSAVLITWMDDAGWEHGELLASYEGDLHSFFLLSFFYRPHDSSWIKDFLHPVVKCHQLDLFQSLLSTRFEQRQPLSEIWEFVCIHILILVLFIFLTPFLFLFFYIDFIFKSFLRLTFFLSCGI